MKPIQYLRLFLVVLLIVTFFMIGDLGYSKTYAYNNATVSAGLSGGAIGYGVVCGCIILSLTATFLFQQPQNKDKEE